MIVLTLNFSICKLGITNPMVKYDYKFQRCFTESPALSWVPAGHSPGGLSAILLGSSSPTQDLELTFIVSLEDSSAHSDHGDLSSAHPRSGNPNSLSLPHSASGQWALPCAFHPFTKNVLERKCFAVRPDPLSQARLWRYEYRTNSKDRHFHKHQKLFFRLIFFLLKYSWFIISY